MERGREGKKEGGKDRGREGRRAEGREGKFLKVKIEKLCMTPPNKVKLFDITI